MERDIYDSLPASCKLLPTVSALGTVSTIIEFMKPEIQINVSVCYHKLRV